LKVHIPACGGNALFSVRWKEWRRSRIVSRSSWAGLHRYAKHCGQEANPPVSLEGDVEVTIRHVQSGDAAAPAQLMCELGYETTKSDMQMRVARMATDERYRTFVAVRDGKVCGMIGTFAYYSFGHNNPCGRIVALVVRKDSRRLAFGGGWSWRWKKTLSDEASSASPWIHGLREKTRTRFMSARLRTKRVAICEATCSD
jgi:hypothetical protein